MDDDLAGLVRAHYERHWNVAGRCHALPVPGPWHGRFNPVVILELPPARHPTWIYATCGMTRFQRDEDIEIHLHAPQSSPIHVETLTAIAHYHLTATQLGLGQSINLGRPWLPGSGCDRGLISLPYLDGPDLERCPLDGWEARCLWLVPVTPSEVAFKSVHGLDALESRFEANGLDYANPMRRAVI